MSDFWSGPAPWVLTGVVAPSIAAIAQALRSVYQTHVARIKELELREAESNKLQLANQQKFYETQLANQKALHETQVADHRQHLAAQVEVYKGAVEREHTVTIALGGLDGLPDVVENGIKAMQEVAVSEREHTVTLVRACVREETDRMLGALRSEGDRVLAVLREMADRPSNNPPAQRKPR